MAAESGITPATLVEVIHRDVFKAAQRDVLEDLVDPPGRNPSPRLVALREWYARLSDEDRAMLAEVVRDAADQAVFGLLCLLDNVRPVVDGFKEEVALKVTSSKGERPLAVREVMLHDLFRQLADAETGFDLA